MTVAELSDGCAFDVFHDKVRAAAVCRAGIVYLGDVGMVQQGQSLTFGLETGNYLFAGYYKTAFGSAGGLRRRKQLENRPGRTWGGFFMRRSIWGRGLSWVSGKISYRRLRNVAQTSAKGELQ